MSCLFITFDFQLLLLLQEIINDIPLQRKQTPEKLISSSPSYFRLSLHKAFSNKGRVSNFSFRPIFSITNVTLESADQSRRNSFNLLTTTVSKLVWLLINWKYFSAKKILFCWKLSGMRRGLKMRLLKNLEQKKHNSCFTSENKVWYYEA